MVFIKFVLCFFYLFLLCIWIMGYILGNGFYMGRDGKDIFCFYSLKDLYYFFIFVFVFRKCGCYMLELFFVGWKFFRRMKKSIVDFM